MGSALYCSCYRSTRARISYVFMLQVYTYQYVKALSFLIAAFAAVSKFFLFAVLFAPSLSFLSPHIRVLGTFHLVMT
jgi:hypothetical protein